MLDLSKVRKPRFKVQVAATGVPDQPPEADDLMQVRSIRRPPARRALAAAILLAAAALIQPFRTAAAAEGKLRLTVVDKQSGRPIACRMHLRVGREDGRIRKVPSAPFWHDHFVFPGQIELKLPLGEYFFTLEHGPEYVQATGRFTLERNADDAKTVELVRGIDMAASGWYAGDLEVRRPLEEIGLLIRSEGIRLAEVVAADAKPPGRGDKLVEPPACEAPEGYTWEVSTGRLEHPGGSLTVYGLKRPLQLASAGGEYPAISSLAAAVRKTHPGAWIDLAHPASWDLPLLVAHGAVDSVRVVHGQFCRDEVIDRQTGLRERDKARYPGADGLARWSQQIYFHLLNCGLRIPPTAASLSGEVPNPVGYNRTYVHLEGPFSAGEWWQGLRAGQVTVGNGPLLLPLVEGKPPGCVFHAPAGAAVELQPLLSISYRSHEPLRYLELIRNGEVEYSLSLDDYVERKGNLLPLKFEQSGWFLIRAVSEISHTYRFSITGPYYVQIGSEPHVSRRSAEFFLDWVYERARMIRLDDPEERRQVIDAHRQARDFWQAAVARAAAP
jgi:hypothetical protein